MTRSKLFLGVTTGLLAVVGVVAAKSSHRAVNVPSFYITTVNKTFCTVCQNGSYTNTPNGTQAICKGAIALKLYTEPACVVPAYRRTVN